MMHVLDDDLTDALDKVEEYAPLWAKAKKDRVVLEEFKRSKRSELFLQASGSTVAEKEHWAYAHKGAYSSTLSRASVRSSSKTCII